MEKMVFRELLDDFGIPLMIYVPVNGKTGHRDPDLGTWIKDEPEPVDVIEPFIPASPNDFFTSSGGTVMEYDRQWFSTHSVPVKTQVKNTTSDEIFEVVNVEPWNDYSDVFIYELKAVKKAVDDGNI